MLSRRLAASERYPLVAWVIVGVAALVTLIRIIVALTSEDNSLFETFQVLLIAVALVYILVVNYPSYTARHPVSQEAASHPRDPRLASFFASSIGSSTLWFTVRMYVGVVWFLAGYEKLRSDAWRSGVSLQGFWTYISAPPKSANPAVAYEWYRQLILFMVNNHWYTWFNWVVAFGELFIGLGLLLGVLTGFAAFFGSLLNFSFGLSGVAGVNPLLLILALLVVWAWKVSGYYGLDQFVLPRLGTFWQAGTLFKHEAAAPAPPAATA